MDPMEVTTPQDWPEDSWPTAEQLGGWLGRCTDEERVEFAGRAIRAAQDRFLASISGERL